MTVQFFDDFDRTDNTDLGANWDSGYSGIGAAQIVGNEVRNGVLGSGMEESVNAISPGDAQYAQIKVVTLTGAVFASVGVCLRMTAPPTDTRYAAEVFVNNGTTTLEIYKVIASSFTTLLALTSPQFVAGDILRFVADKTRLQAFRNGQLVGQVEDGSISSGRIGIVGFMDAAGSLANAELDNFLGGDASGLVDNARGSAFPKQKIAEDFIRRNLSRGYEA